MKLCFVVPRCGENIVGGAETLVLKLASKLQEQRGHEVLILSSCASDARTWENVLPQGEDVAMGVRVLRFPLDQRDLDTWLPLQIAISRGQRVTLEQEFSWMASFGTSGSLLDWLVRNQSGFEAIFFAPYLFGMTFWGSLAVREKAWLIPCLHDESYAYTQCVEGMFRGVGRALFNSAPERDLAQALYGPISGGEVGMGFEPDVAAATASPISGRYCVVLGRKETGKNAQVAIDYFIEGKRRGMFPDDLKLVIAGGGDFSDLERDAALLRGDVVDLKRVEEPEKLALLRDALVLIQPSTNESFSIVLMESWLQNTPALVNARGAVTRDHVVRSGGGLYFNNAEEFAGAIALLLKEPALRAVLGSAGARYVAERYSWEAVLNRFDAALSAHDRAAGSRSAVPSL
jgi:glycosyltransferase involved in cell wall biosynthesis